MTTGTKNTAKKGLSAEDICRIISTCKDSGVAEISYGSLSLKFHPHRNQDASVPGQVADHVPVMSENITDIDQKNAELMNEQALKDAEEAQLMIDDSYGYERSQIAKSLERNRTLSEKA